MKGIINLYKPSGITSSTAVGKVRKALGTREVGHMGTLDPAGEGVLIIGVGKATRLFDYFLQKDKVYEAEFAFGYETDTLDGDGVILEETQNIPTLQQITDTLKNFMGELNQLPPKYSAKNVDGKRAYDLARSGIEFELKTSRITVYDFKVLEQTKPNTYKMQIHCSSGTYIRSLCRDLSHSLGSLATMISIKRIRSGKFYVDNSVTIENLNIDSLVSIDDALSDLRRIDLPDECYHDLANGIKQAHEQIDGKFRLYCCNELFGIAEVIDGLINIKAYLRD